MKYHIEYLISLH